MNNDNIMGSIKLNLGCWNARGIMYGSVYADKLLRRLDLDILGISEHWLYPDSIQFLESINSGYSYYAICDNDLFVSDRCRKGKGGVAFLWKKCLSSKIRTLELDCDRAVGITLNLPGCRMITLIMIYLPSANHPDTYFAEYLDYIQELFDLYTTLGEVIIMGDFNSKATGDRVKQQILNPRMRAMDTFLRNTNLISLSTGVKCRGPNYSFDAYDGGPRTLIDHICVSPVIFRELVDCEIMNDDVMNTSDHLPIRAVLKLHYSNSSMADPCADSSQPMCLKRKKFHWKKCLQSDFEKIIRYRTELKRRLPEISYSHVYTKFEIDMLYSEIVSAMVTASTQTIPECVFRGNVRPGWKGPLQSLHNELRHARTAWVQQGKPRSTDSTARAHYKECKSRFRAELRRHNAKLSADFYNDLDESAEADQKRFWRLLKASRRAPDKPPPPMRFGETVYYNATDINNKWADYFEVIYTPFTLEEVKFGTAN